jgi:hypothetical protein
MTAEPAGRSRAAGSAAAGSDHREAVDAFVSKRKASFMGK